MGVDAATLLKERERLSPLLENFVLQELRRQASWRPDPIEFFHYRDRDDFEVDIVGAPSGGTARHSPMSRIATAPQAAVRHQLPAPR